MNFAINPYRGVFTGARDAIPISAKIMDLMGKRHKYSNVIDGVLYESDDSYAQSFEHNCHHFHTIRRL